LERQVAGPLQRHDGLADAGAAANENHVTGSQASGEHLIEGGECSREWDELAGFSSPNHLVDF
jgi:hypothetical protein